MVWIAVFWFCFPLERQELYADVETFAPLGGSSAPEDYDTLWSNFDARAEPLETEVLHTWEEQDTRLSVVRFRIGHFKGKVARLAGVFGVPARWKSGDDPLPGLLQIHGGGQYADYKACLAGAKRGYAVLSIAWAGRISAPEYRISPREVAQFWAGQTDEPSYRITTDWGAVDGYHAPSRNAGNSFPSIRAESWTLDSIESPRNSGWFLCAVAARRALTFLEQQPEVDSERLGVYGHSMGGKLTVMTAADPRVKAAVPSCGGISDRVNKSELFRKTLDDSVYLKRIKCPILFQSPTNDFHGRIGDLPRATNEIQSSDWRVVCSPHHNHQDTAEFEVASLLWFDQHLKRAFDFPATPTCKIRLDGEGGVPLAEVNVDRSSEVESVQVYFCEQAKRDEKPEDREHTIHRFWHPASTIEKDGKHYAELPLQSASGPIWVIANVTYRLKESYSGAGYYYREFTTDRYVVSSLLQTITPEALSEAKVQATRESSLLIEDFREGWQASWFRYRNEPWSWSTNKLYDPTWQAPENARLGFKVQSSEANQLVVMIDGYAADIDLAGGDAWQEIELSASDFKDYSGETLGSWSGIRQLKFSPVERLRPARGVDGKPRLVGKAWKGPEPSFAQLQWISDEEAPRIPVSSVADLVKAAEESAPGSVIQIAAGRYELERPLVISSGVKLIGAGIDQTIITHMDQWKASTKSLPDPETRLEGLDMDSYLVRLARDVEDVEIANLTLKGPQVHGAIFGVKPNDLHVHHVKIEDFMWSGIRTLAMVNSRIHDCEFVDAGGKWKRGGVVPEERGGISGGALFLTWVKDTEISHNRFRRTKSSNPTAHFGIKGRQGKRCRIHHNTIGFGFSIEFPFEGDEDMEIDHNVLQGAVSIPKHAGGKVPESGRTFHIHHNYFTTSYAIEFVRNGVEIDHNLFDFDVEKDGGNLISGFGKVAAPGPAKFHNNLVSNPGRGVIWINEPYDDFEIRNNHIVARETATPRTAGLFSFNAKSDLSKLRIHHNIVECIELARPLLRQESLYLATVANNRLINVSDASRFPATDEAAEPGLEEPLRFTCGVHDEFLVDGWEFRLSEPK